MYFYPKCLFFAPISSSKAHAHAYAHIQVSDVTRSKSEEVYTVPGYLHTCYIHREILRNYNTTYHIRELSSWHSG